VPAGIGHEGNETWTGECKFRDSLISRLTLDCRDSVRRHRSYGNGRGDGGDNDCTRGEWSIASMDVKSWSGGKGMYENDGREDGGKGDGVDELEMVQIFHGRSVLELRGDKKQSLRETRIIQKERGS